MGKIIKNAIVIVLFLGLSVSTAFLVYLHFFKSEGEDFSKLSGEWTANLDMTKEAAVTALGWLQDIEAVSISLEDMESYMQDLAIQVNLILEQTDGSAGTFQCNVLQESYDACNQAAYEAFAMAFQDLLVERLRRADYTGNMDRENVETLVTETFGMSTASYLMSYGPALLPSLEELRARYQGSGTYEAAEGILTRQFDAGQPAATIAERYIQEDGTLILYEETGSAALDLFWGQYPVMYTLQQSQPPQ